jgi:hypothetical protein
MKTVVIEWRRLVQGGATCKRCGDTGDLLGHPQNCPTIEMDGQAHNVPPAWLIRLGVCRSAGCG